MMREKALDFVEPQSEGLVAIINGQLNQSILPIGGHMNGNAKQQNGVWRCSRARLDSRFFRVCIVRKYI